MEKENISLKERMSALRATTDYHLPTKGYVMIIIDGHKFSSYVKKRFKLPFDEQFINMMNETAKYVCSKVEGCKFAYVQSDEITFVLTDFDNENTCAAFGNRLTKLTSLIPAMAAARFNQLAVLNMCDTPCSNADLKQMIEGMHLCEFDAKVWFTENYMDVYSYYLWRQIDCIRNSKQQTAQTYLSHKQLHGKRTDEQIDMLLAEKGIDWNTFPDDQKYGRFIYKEEVEIESPNNDEPVKRKKWFIHDAFPIATEEGRERFLNLNIIPLKQI